MAMACTASLMLQPLLDLNASRCTHSRSSLLLPNAISTNSIQLRRNTHLPLSNCWSIIGDQGCGSAKKINATVGISAKCKPLGSTSRSARRVVADHASGNEVLVQETSGEKSKQVEYNWELEWYPMYVTDEMPKATPLGLTVFDRSLVLFYDGFGILNCFEDRCPHRSAKLSEGQVTDGRLECLYNGYQYEGSGAC